MLARRFGIWALIVVLVGIAVLPLPDFWITQLNYIGLYSLVCLGLVLLTGIAGLTSFGQAAFVGLGAYATAWICTAPEAAELAAHEYRQHLRDAQAQAGARHGGAPAGAAPLEGHEDAFMILRLDTDAAVFDLKLQHRAAAVHAQNHLAGVGEADRVA